MAKDSLEQSIQHLKEALKVADERSQRQDKVLKTMALRLRRQESVTEIQNLMSSFWMWTGKEEKVTVMWALNTPGVRIELDGIGAWDGADGIRKYQEAHGLKDRKGSIHLGVGALIMHLLTSSIIEVAGDGKTAKAVWMSPGVETVPGKDGKVDGKWLWNQIACDFVIEDGKWKIWHLHMFPIFKCSYYKSWVDDPWIMPGSANFPDDLKPDRLSSTWRPYTLTTAREIRPTPPEPFETYDNSDYMG